MGKELVPDELWAEAKELIPEPKEQPKGGRPPADDRACLRAILFVQRSGIAWQMLPTEVFGVSGSTCWRRFRDWTESGLWAQLHKLILRHLGKIGKLDLSHAVVDSASVRAVFGGPIPAPTPPTGPRKAASAT